jgi:hypothetical protein
MTRISAAIVLAGALLASALPLSAHERFRFVGTVVALDDTKLLTIKTKVSNADFTAEIQITNETTIQRDGQPAPESDLKAGVTVVVDAWGDDYFDLEALTIRIVPPIQQND